MPNRLVKRRVANPAPAVLALVNPKGHKTMAAKKRHTGRKRNAAKSTTTAKRKTTTRAKKRHSSTFNAQRPASTSYRWSPERGYHSNPTRKRHTSHRRHRNPSGGGLVEEAINFSVAGFTLGLVQPIVRGAAARFVGSSPVSSALVTALTGYGLGYAADRVGMTRRLARPLKVLGISMAVTQLATQFIGPMLKGAGNPSQGLGNTSHFQARRGFNGIGVVTGVPPVVVAPPPALPAKANSAGMNGIALTTPIPGKFR